MAGCRKLDPLATGYSHVAMEGQTRIDHCPGIYVDTPFIQWLYELLDAHELGMTLSIENTSLAVMDSLVMLSRIRKYTSAIVKKEQMEEYQRNSNG
jgi:hypothetical protein